LIPTVSLGARKVVITVLGIITSKNIQGKTMKLQKKVA